MPPYEICTVVSSQDTNFRNFCGIIAEIMKNHVPVASRSKSHFLKIKKFFIQNVVVHVKIQKMYNPYTNSKNDNQLGASTEMYFI